MNTVKNARAVMSSRAEPKKSKDGKWAKDDFPTPPWATRALCEWLARRYLLRSMTCHEPAANRGYMVRPLSEYFGRVTAADIHDYGAGYPVQDYLAEDPPLSDFTITNPPFVRALEFIQRAQAHSRKGVAVLVRTTFLETKGRYKDLFSVNPPTVVLQFVERVPIHKGVVRKKADTATSYCWLFWDTQTSTRQCRLEWIPLCRDRLRRDTDYLMDDET